MHPIPPRPVAPRQRGFALLEALIAFLVLSIGMLALTRLQSDLRDPRTHLPRAHHCHVIDLVRHGALFMAARPRVVQSYREPPRHSTR